MPLGTLHDNYNAHPELNDAAGNPATTYMEARDNMLKRKENIDLFLGYENVSIVHNDSAGIPTIGYGFNLSASAHTADQVRSALTHALGGTLTAAQEQGIQILMAWNKGTDYNGTAFTDADIIALAKGKGGLVQHQTFLQSIALTEAQSTTLLHAYLDGAAGLPAIDGAFGLGSADSVSQSTERLALLDLRYAGLLGKGAKGAVAGIGQAAESPRAAAWFEARYNHKNTTHTGLQPRRVMESRLIGLVQEGLNTKETLQETLVAVSYLYKYHFDLIKQRDGLDNFEAAIATEKI